MYTLVFELVDFIRSKSNLLVLTFPLLKNRPVVDRGLPDISYLVQEMLVRKSHIFIQSMTRMPSKCVGCCAVSILPW